MNDFLDMPDWTTTARTRTARDEVTAEATYGPEPDACQKCGVEGEFDRWGGDEITIRDSPARRDKVIIKVARRRYLCRACNRRFDKPKERANHGRSTRKSG